MGTHIHHQRTRKCHQLMETWETEVFELRPGLMRSFKFLMLSPKTEPFHLLPIGKQPQTPVLESFVQIGTSWRKSRNIFRLSASWKWPRIKPSYHPWYTSNTGDNRSITFHNEELSQKTHLKVFFRPFGRIPAFTTEVNVKQNTWSIPWLNNHSDYSHESLNLHMYNHGKVGFRSTSNQNI